MAKLVTTRRRALLGAAAGAALAFGVQSASAATQISLICPRSPNPTPPGYGGYAQTELSDWQDANGAYVSVEAVSWEQIHDKIVAGFEGRAANHNVNYIAGWAPEFSAQLANLDGLVSSRILADTPASSANAVTWNGVRYGAPLSLSILTLYSNAEHFAAAGIPAPPTTWAELLSMAKTLTNANQSGWIINYGAPAGIGGTTSYWMVFLQQAGGTMFAHDGSAAFNSDAGIAALEFMLSLMPYTHPSALSSNSINDVTAAFMSGGASMMMNWPFMWNIVNDRSSSPLYGKVRTSLLPAGPAGTASIDGADAWAISAKASQHELCGRLINFFLSSEIQIEQAISTGWLPIRQSTITDPRLLAACPHAPVVFEQAKHPYNSFLTPDYADITQAIGEEIAKVLAGRMTSTTALANAARSVNAIVKARE